jgi:putative ABC transport system permease protein
MPRQYEQTFLYDVLCAASSDEHEELSEAVRNHKDTGIYADIMIISADVSVHNGRPETVQAIIFDDETDVSQYVSLRDIKGNPLQLGMHDIMITQNAGNVLGFKDGDTISVQLNDLQKAELPVRNLVQNYLGNYLFMRRSAYEDYYHDFMENGLLIRLNDKDCDAAAYTQLLKSKPNVMSVISTAELRDQFSTAFVLINAVVYIVIIMSAALAFVVLFTLSSINVSERTREIATIKVLGFFDGEVHTYIDKETVILTVIGIAAGLPLGWAFAQTLTAILNLPSIYLAVSLHGVSYFYAAGLTLLFMVIVNLSSDRVLDRVDPVEALKSVE